MVDIFAALQLAAAASKVEAGANLFADAMILYGVYAKAKGGALTPAGFAHAPDLRQVIIAANNVLRVANELAKDPVQYKNLVSVIASL